tara:strand:+ start:132 stop:524 length:393 start_codon:yes stop_codon:yes gene_type:complete
MAKEKLKGIGGWLLIYAILLVIGFLSGIPSLYPLIFSFLHNSISGKIVVILGVIGFIFGLNSIILIFQYSKKAIFGNIYMLAYNMIATPIIIIIFKGFEAIFQILIVILINYVWIHYWLVSKRVTNTFVE